MTDRDHGAHFHRTDFQVHTPRDARWKGQRPKNEAERQAYAERFVRQCRVLGLHAVAITDHHDLVMAPVIRAAARAETDADGNVLPADQQLVVFPGVELTLGVPCQALLILDADLPDDRLPQVLEALDCEAHDPAADKLPDVKVLEHITSLRDLYDILNRRDWLRDHFIVLPNVTDKGHQTLMRSGMATKYKEMPCVGGYLDGTVDKIGTGNATKFAGKDASWGNKSIAIFQTSDARSDDFTTLGTPSTWVKWAEPTAEAVRQACLGPESRIAHAEPELPSVLISRLTVSNSKFLGPIDVAFNAQYNAVIGGRGTGKSTILDYLRWGLCDQAAQAGDEELANPTVRRERLIENTLKPLAGQVEVHFSINEIPHVVRRDSASGEILLKVGPEEFTKVREDHVRSLLPIHAYSQKQLSSVALKVDELTRFVTAPIQRSLDGLEQKITELAGRLRENYAKVQRARDLDLAVERQHLAERSLAEQAANLRSSLADLSEDDRKILDLKPMYDSVRQRLDAQQRDLDALEELGQRFLGQIESTKEQSIAGESPDDLTDVLMALASGHQRLLDDLGRTVADALKAIERAREPESELAGLEQAARTSLAEFNVLYAEVTGRSTAHQAKLDELADVERRREDSAQLLARHREDRKGLGDPIATHAKLRADLVDLYRQRTQLLVEESERLSKLSDGLLRSSINRGRGLAAVEQKFKGFIQGSGVRGGKVEQLFVMLAKESDPLGTWEAVLGELEAIMLLEEDAEHTTETTPVLSRLEFPLADQQRIRSRITADGLLDLALTPIKDEPEFEYQTKEQEYIAFSAASAGQQATALLRVLLSQAGMPLIIDQPEEDLDSQVVQDVVARIWEAKKKRQIIFASHNANLVVNGDAELVIACDYRKQGDQSGGRIKLEGAIDVPAVRDEITRVMEGGEKAFRLRKEKYGF